MCKRTGHIILFSFGLLMVLLRPFMAYQISSRADFSRDPQKVHSLLQRLIKKKDDHHGELSELFAIERAQIKIPRLLPVASLRFRNVVPRIPQISRYTPGYRGSGLFFTARLNLLVCRFQI